MPSPPRSPARNGAAGSEAATRDFVDYWNAPGAFDALDPSWRAAIAPRADGVAANFDALEGASFPLSAVRAIAAPTLLLAGGATRPAAQRIVARLFDALPLAALATIAGAGHMLPFTHEGPVNERILAHIRAAEGISNAILPALDRAA
jgi:pimeloyl-ACP methyl ester carboxylesterase